MAKHLSHLKSKVVETTTVNGVSVSTPKLPTPAQLWEGEIAVNFAKGYERLSIKNDQNEIVSFLNENDLYEVERVTAASLNDLNNRLNDTYTKDEVNETIEETKLIEITYFQLKTKKLNNELIPGTWYRITDYATTTAQADTRSAGHNFDIIVLATDTNTINENAKAIKHAGDTYFADSNLNAWELKYCLDNDTDKFAWADTINGKGVIYYMKDEWDNECPYDFKNIQFKRWKVTVDSASYTTFDSKYAGLTFNGTVYPMGYTINDSDDFVWLYTFSAQKATWDSTNQYLPVPGSIDSSTVIYDLSNVDMSGFYNSNNYGCNNNIIKSSFRENLKTQVLNNIILNGWFVDITTLPNNYEEYYGNRINRMMDVPYNNHFESNCLNNTFINASNNNTFEIGCIMNTFDTCQDNTFGAGFNGNTFAFCVQNTFGKNCTTNTMINCTQSTFGNVCSNNIGGMCSRIKFGNQCTNNTFGNSCAIITFGDYCGNNTFGTSCQYNIFGNYCSNNTFGNNCESNIFGNSCTYNTFERACKYNNLENNNNRIIFVKPATEYCTVENGNQYITLTTQPSQLSNILFLRNITIAQGCNNSNTNKTITHDTLNDTFKTTYQNSNSQIINV